MNNDIFISVEEISQRLNCSQQYIRKLLREGRIAGEKVGETWVILKENIDNLDMKDLKAKQTTEDRVSQLKPSKTKLNALSFFSGAMGMDIGLEKAGINTLLASDIEEACKKTITLNHPKIGLISNLLDYSVEEILRYANVDSAKEIDLIVGGPPCQAFSTAGKRLGFQEPRGNVFLKFIDLIATIKPKYCVIENVRGLLSSTMTIDIQDQLLNKYDFDFKKYSGSSLFYIKKKLESSGYAVRFNLYNSANFGVPQSRERVVMICTLDKTPVPYLTPTNSDNKSFGLPKFKTFKEAVKGLNPKKGNYINFSEKRLKYIKMLKAGENWRNLPLEIQEQAMGGSFLLQGGKTGFYRRLAWDKPSPTLVTHPAMPATELAHPSENRPLSIEEYKKIQEFPDEWILCGSLLDQYKQVGNAVPVGLGFAIGKEIINHSKGKKPNSFPNFKYSRYNNTDDQSFEREFLKQTKSVNSNQAALELFV